MEIKAKIKIPYTEKERADFIVKNNHRLNYDIKETKKELQAWGMTQEEQEQFEEEQRKQKRIAELEKYLTMTDWYAIRFADTDEEIPAEIKKARQDAREEISKLRETK